MSDPETAIKGRIGIWGALSQLTALVAGFVTTFLVKPPLLFDESGTAIEDTTIRIICLGIFVSVFIAIKTINSEKKIILLRRVSIIFFLISIVSSVSYAFISQSWSCQFPGSDRYVIGTEYTKVAKEVKARNQLVSCGDVMFVFSEDNIAEVWDKDEMISRYYILVFWYLLNAAAILASLLVGVELIQRSFEVRD